MPFINSKVSVQVTPEQEKKLKTRLHPTDYWGWNGTDF